LQTAVNPKGPSAGYFLAVNINRSGKQRIWYDSITIKPNTTYSFSCILANVSTLPRVFSVDPPFIRDARPEHSFVENPGILKLCINGKKVSRALMLTSFSEWRTLSGKFTSGPDQTRIEIAIQDMMSPIFNNLVAVDNIVFKEIQAGEFVKKEDRFSKLGVKGGVVYYKKEEPPIEIPPVKKEEPIAVITSPVKKEEAVIEIPSPKEEEPVVETPPVKEEEPVVEILSKKEPSVVIPPKPKPLIVVPSKPLAIVHPPKPKPPIVIRPKAKSSVLVPSIPVKKDTASKIVAVSTDFKKDISIDEIKVDQKLQLSHIYFERAKYNLLTTSFPELNDMVTFMKRYPTVRIRLEGHTDNQGNPQLNLELSENRAKEVKKYLVDLGIDENRIEWIGYGGQRPIDSNPTADENLRPKNRRVEVVIISK
jgi:outer membrane protein OmpA-like peptidoglycan-associated protein